MLELRDDAAKQGGGASGKYDIVDVQEEVRGGAVTMQDEQRGVALTSGEPEVSKVCGEALEPRPRSLFKPIE